MMETKALLNLLVLMLTLGTFSTVEAITDGEVDGQGHPYVGLMVAQDAGGKPLWRCSGTLLSPTLFLTAGHCTDGAVHVEIWFAADVDAGMPDNGYPSVGNGRGTPYTHPSYDPNEFYLYDLGVVILDTPIELNEFGKLPKYGQLNSQKNLRGQQGSTFTAVGYGKQASFPEAASWKDQAFRVRMVAYPKLIQINTGFVGDYSLLLSNNANAGGTCFGDSGGPNFIGTSSILAGVTSFGMNGNCAGTGGVYRVDQKDDLDWLYGEFGEHIS
jgi:secreted trypsin-like serine protease